MLQALYKMINYTTLSVSNCQPQSRLNRRANRLFYKLSRRRQRVPGTCSRHREGVITHGWAAHWWQDQRRYWSRPETPTNFYISIDYWYVGIVLVGIGTASLLDTYNAKIRVFGVGLRFERRKLDKKQTYMKTAAYKNLFLQYLEYFCQMLLKSIFIIRSYTASNVVRFSGAPCRIQSTVRKITTFCQFVLC